MSDDKPAGGRFKRMAKLAGLGARLSTELATRGAKKLAGAATEGVLSSVGAEKLVSTLGELKGLAMKVGQSLAMDPSLLTPEVQAIIARLQNQAPPMAFATVSQVVTQELGAPPAERFARFDETPLASASLGQVHGAQTREGDEVVVKVQYPNVDQAVKADLANIESTAVVLSRAAGVPAQSYFGEIRTSLMDELDYRAEATNAQSFADACAWLPDLRVPKTYPALSANRVLTLERLGGETLKDFIGRKSTESNARRFEVSRQLIRATFGPFLSRGLIHGDPHPGNYLLMPDGKLGLLDFGNVKQTSRLWQSVNRRLIEFGAGPPGKHLDTVALSREAGFTIKTDPEKLRPFIDALISLVLEPLVQPHYDFGTAQVLQRTRNLFLQNALLVKTKLLPPTDGLVYYRAMVGLVQNLQTLGANGNFRAVYQELVAQAPPLRN